MTIHRVVFSPEAESDLDLIYAHIAAASGETRASSVISHLVERCRSLDLFPYRGIARNDLFPGLRVVAYRDWASIAFTIDGATVTIEGVLWRGRDTSILSDRTR